jgi:hypothetical protein
VLKRKHGNSLTLKDYCDDWSYEAAGNELVLKSLAVDRRTDFYDSGFSEEEAGWLTLVWNMNCAGKSKTSFCYHYLWMRNGSILSLDLVLGADFDRWLCSKKLDPAD